MSGLPMLIYGCSDYANLLSVIAQDCGWVVAGFIDDYADCGQSLGNYANVSREYPPSQYSLAIGIGYSDLKSRRMVLKRCIADGWTMPSIIHPQSLVHPTAHVQMAAVIMHGAIVDVRASVGYGSVCWPGSIISHDSYLGNNCFLSPNATICGFVNTGHSCFFGASSVITERSSPPSGFFLKAGQRFTNHKNRLS
jgi:acetyltransferase-like isoleucine patch superfamily enzyme